MVKLRHSISAQLFKVIFGLYLVVTVIVTTIQMWSEYNYVKDTIRQEIQLLPENFLPGLSEALWTFNDKAQRSILIGMHEVEYVSGVSIDDGKKTESIGIVRLTDERHALYDEYGNLLTEKIIKPFGKLISHEFDIKHEDVDGKEIVLGKGVIYTSSEVVIDRVKHGFFLIIVNAVIKTAALWLIFLFFMRRILSEPLIKFANDTEKINVETVGEDRIEVQGRPGTELKVLEASFNKLIDKVVAYRQQLNDMNASLEEEVQQRTQQLENEVQVRRVAQRQAEESNRLKTNFVNSISHEIRTPLTSIYGMARFLQSAVKDKENKKYADIVVRNCETLNTLIMDILDFSKYEAGYISFDKVEFDVRACIEDTKNLFELQVARKKIPLVIEIDDAVPATIKGDKKRLKQVLTNLVNNAFKFTEKGEIKLRAAPYTNNGKEQLMVSVSDTGIGIPADKLDSVFESFVQVDSTTERNFGGTGLGLAICKRFVEMMGGEIHVESEPGVGSTFTFTIDC